MSEDKSTSPGSRATQPEGSTSRIVTDPLPKSTAPGVPAPDEKSKDLGAVVMGVYKAVLSKNATEKNNIAAMAETPSASKDGPEGAASGSKTNGNPAAGAKPADEETKTPSWIVGGAVWVAILGFIAFLVFWTRDATIKLEVSPADPMAVKGVVLYDGQTVNGGFVELKFDEPKTKRFLGSTVLGVTNGGHFSTAPSTLTGTALASPSVGTNKQLRITATYNGRTMGKDGKTEARAAGETVVYTNFSPPVGSVPLWASLIGLLVLFGVLMILFTGQLTTTRANFLFAITYVMTFLALAVPLGMILLVSQNAYLVQLMEESPVGLVKAKAKGVTDSQWLLNIGGILQTELVTTKPADNRTAGGAPAATTTPAASGAGETGGGTPAPTQDAGRANASIPNASLVSTVVGGLAIPFYVIILAMFGAAINMTRQVPEIQNRYDLRVLREGKGNRVIATLALPLSLISPAAPASQDEQQIKTNAGIRQAIIENYMGLLSAPFIAIAVFYLLQVIATSVAEPVLVLMAFSTGLASDVVVRRIIEVAQRTLGSGQPTGKAGGRPTGSPPNEGSKSPVPASAGSSTVSVPKPAPPRGKTSGVVAKAVAHT